MQQHKKQEKSFRETIDICDREFIGIRAQLIEAGSVSAAWIRDSFLKSSNVHVANEEHFLETLDHWSIDPCDWMM